MARSILQDAKECWYCGTTQNIECHHIIFGRGLRKISERLGLKVWLCADHHRGAYSPHQRRDFDLRLRRAAQSIFVDTHSQEEWMEEVGRNYL